MRLQVGAVAVIVPADRQAIGTALGEAADQIHDWAGLGRVDIGELTLAIAPDRATFARWSAGSVPSWGAGLMLPGARLVVVRLDGGDPYQTLRHELAHVALHRKISVRVPRVQVPGAPPVYASMVADTMPLAGRLNLAAGLPAM